MKLVITAKFVSEQEDADLQGQIDGCREHLALCHKESVFGPPEKVTLRYLIEGLAVVEEPISVPIS